VEPVVGVVVAGAAVLVCVVAGAGVVVGGATVPGWAAPVGAEVLVVAEAGVVLVGNDVAAGVAVVAVWTLADAGNLTPGTEIVAGVAVPAAWAPTGSSTASAHANARPRGPLCLTVIAVAMLTAAL
jgi:hypothetical protein